VRTADAARAIRTLAAGNVHVPALQLLAADLTAAAGDPSGAFEIARRTETTFPDSAASAQQAAELAACAGRWADAVEAGRRWRELAGRRDDGPETLVDEALTRTGRAVEAVAALEPRMSDALADPDRHDRLLVVAAAALLRSGDDARAADTVRRVAHGSARRLSLVLDADCGLFADAAQARKWLAACADEVPPADTAARVELARAWSRAWQRFRTPDLLADARAVVAPLTSSPDAPAAAHLIGATLAQQDGDLAAARSGYVAALARDPRLLDARNNLAVVLADLGLANEAVAEATTATRAAPDVPEYLDTLAYALRKAHETQRARESLDQAIRLDPANPKWMASLAETLAESGDPGAAAKVAAKAQAIAAGGGELDPELRDRLARLARPR
jgi:Tfp pilus assembly protein PilF